MILGSLDKFITVSGEFVFTLTNNGYKLLTLNLVRQIQALKVPWTLCVICADKGSYLFFTQEGIPCRRIETPLPDMGPSLSPFGTKNFQTLNRVKLSLLTECIQKDEIEVGIYLDGDIAVYRDFLPDISDRVRRSDTKFFFQCDEKGREECSDTCPNFCTGVIVWKKGADSSLFSIKNDKALWDSTPEDQVYVNTRFRLDGEPFQTLPRSQYPNGMFASLPGIKQTAYLLHYNYLVGAMKQKKMKANGDWVLPY